MKLPEKMRLQRMIALSSELSRRAAEEAITRGEIKVNGEVVTALGTTVNPKTDELSWKGKRLHLRSQRRYLAYHKPRGVLVTKCDPQKRPTIWNGLNELKRQLNTVGRLDLDSEGLILLTDDGDFLNRMTHPRHGVWKVYRVWVVGVPSAGGLSLLKNGIKLKEGKTLPARVRVVKQSNVDTLLEIGIREGKYRQVRRMCDEIGCPVKYLKRISIGPVKLDKLKAGKWRELRPDEVTKLFELARE